MSTDPISYAIEQKWLSFAVIGSIFTWKLISSLREYIFDPILDQALPDKKFNIFDIPLGDEQLRLGALLKEFIKWIIVILILYLIYKYTSLPKAMAKIEQQT